MHPIIASLLVLAAIVLQPQTQTQTEPNPWDLLHPSTQRYLEKNAKYYVIDDSGRLWNRKLFLEDEATLSKLSRNARDLRLAARLADNAPAWYGVLSGRKLSTLPGNNWYVDEFNRKNRESRVRILNKSHSRVFVSFEVSYDWNGAYFHGSLVDSDGVSIFVQLDAFPGSAQFANGDTILLAHELRLVEYKPYGAKIIPRYTVVPNPELDVNYPLHLDGSFSFHVPTPQELATIIVNENISSLPQWRFRRKLNPEYSDWRKLVDSRDVTHWQVHGFPSKPNQYIYTWTNKPYRIRYAKTPSTGDKP